MILETTNHKYRLLSRLGLLLNAEIAEDFDYLLPGQFSVEEEKELTKNLRRDITDAKIDGMLSDVCHLVLTLTEKCNLQCKYCLYSGAYSKSHRLHSNKSMGLDTAEKAVDLCLLHAGRASRKTTIREISIGFYGGEPLLEMDLLKAIVSYVEKESSRLGLRALFSFIPSLSTNGLLLNDSTVDYLVKNNVSIAVSIDGPRMLHDRFRVTASQKGSWQTVMDNLRRLKKRYPEFYSKKVTFLCTVQPVHDGEAIDDFFLSHSDLFNPDRITFSSLRTDDLEQPESISPENGSDESTLRTSKLYFEKSISKTLAPEKFKVNRLTPGTKFTGTCSPCSNKYFVDVDGDIHMCESIAGTIPVGNVFKGFYLDEIRRLIHAFNEQILKSRCWECEVWFICSACFSTALKGKQLEMACPKKQIINNLETYLQMRESKNENLLRNTSINSVDDYLDFLQ